ncbi:MAG TPA: dTMP kinase [Candidatus Pelagibacter bacterium]|jgi:dTMP kinase|nr:dTMP kinase [Candidatus Pelagibacter bacterium]|tara:strand:+ start:573 stop:1190 length:618 start_codon:yes stop_codon:yes gene_type:complete
MYKYPVIVFEGIETSGKSTNLKIVAKYLNNINRKFIKIREPGGTTLSEIFRKLILNKKSKLNFKTDLMLIMASRSENIDKIIKNNYGKKIIIIDRFVDSTIAYQHYGMGINLNLINKLNNFLLDRFKPTFTFLSIVNKKNMKIRLNKRFSLNKYDKFDLSFYNKVQKGFLNIAKDKKNYFIIDSNENNIEENSQIIIKKIKKLVS